MNLILRNRAGYPLPGSLRTTVFGNLLDTMLDDFLAPATEGARDTSVFSPRLDLTETDKAYVIDADLPGVAKSDLKVSVDGQRVTLEAEVRRDTERKEGETVVHAERIVRKYARSIELPGEVDDANAVAKLENGVLSLVLPKKQAAQSRLLTIQ
jgi:HSP20 family protein